MVCSHVDDLDNVSTCRMLVCHIILLEIGLFQFQGFDPTDYKAKSNLECSQDDNRPSKPSRRKKRMTDPKEEAEVVAEYQREADFMRKTFTLFIFIDFLAKFLFLVFFHFL